MTRERLITYATAFLRRKWNVCAKWDAAGTRRWVQWFVDHDRALIITDKDRIQCVALYRMVNTPEEAHSPFANHERGPVAYIEVCASHSKLAMHGGYSFLMDKVGSFATHIAWVRGKYANRVSIQPLIKAAAHLALPVAKHNTAHSHG